MDNAQKTLEEIRSKLDTSEDPQFLYRDVQLIREAILQLVELVEKRKI